MNSKVSLRITEKQRSFLDSIDKPDSEIVRRALDLYIRRLKRIKIIKKGSV